jgi:hypothetical protein
VPSNSAIVLQLHESTQCCYINLKPAFREFREGGKGVFGHAIKPDSEFTLHYCPFDSDPIAKVKVDHADPAQSQKAWERYLR